MAGQDREFVLLEALWESLGDHFSKFWKSTSDDVKCETLVIARDMLEQRFDRGALFLLLCPELENTKLSRLTVGDTFIQILELRLNVA